MPGSGHGPRTGKAAMDEENTKDSKGSRNGKAGLVGSEGFWRLLATVMVATIAWAIWLMWQLTPRPAVTEMALKSQIKPISNLPRPAPDTGPEVPAQLQQGQPVELRMATELKPPAEPAPGATPASPAPAAATPGAAGK